MTPEAHRVRMTARRLVGMLDALYAAECRADKDNGEIPVDNLDEKLDHAAGELRAALDAWDRASGKTPLA